MGQEVIGVCGSGELARHLASLGLAVVGGPDFKQAVAQLREGQNAQGAFPIIVVDSEPTASIRPWVESQSRRADVRIIPGPGGALAGHSLAVDLPISLGDLLASLGLPAPLTDESDLLISDGGKVGAPSTPASMEANSSPAPAATHAPQPMAQMPAVQPPAQMPASMPETHVPAPAPAPRQVAQTPILDSAASSRNVPTAISPGAVEDGPTSDTDEPDWLTEILAEQNPEPEHSAAPPAVHVQPAQQPAMQPHVPVQQPYPAQQQPYQQPAQVQQQPHPAFQQPVQQPLFQQQQQQQQPQQWHGAAPGSVSDYFDSRNQQAQQHFSALAAGNCLIIGSRKGGVGKTTSSTMSAQIAAEAGLRVALVDLNRGQANSSKNLKIAGHPFPTIHDAKTRGWQSAISSSDVMSQIRGGRGPLGFDLVQGPPEHLAAPDETPASLYSEVIRELRKHYDLVVVDTQIAEADFTDLWNEVVIPELRSGAWFLGLFDKSPSAMPDLRWLTERFAQHYGLNPSRVMVAANRWPEGFDDEDESFITRHFNGTAAFIGSCTADPTFSDQILGGFLPTDNPAVSPTLREALYRITGQQAFAPVVLSKRELRKARRQNRRKR